MSSTPAPSEEADRPPGAAHGALDVLAAGAAAALFFAGFLVLPIAGPLALPFAAVPIVRLAHRRGDHRAPGFLRGLGPPGSGLLARVPRALRHRTPSCGRVPARASFGHRP